MLEEAVVLSGEHRLHDDRRYLRPADWNPALLADLGQQQAVAAVDPQRYLQPDVAQLRDIGQRRFQVVEGRQQREPQQAGERDDHRGGEGQAADQAGLHGSGRGRGCLGSGNYA